ncbi:hypothetical protein QBC35DRAFT_223516 [Podospora australis]|uniref:Uncharacterized protein n=1 Tax=Podospora australis TaxID=1536484 RepID=A0AAN6X1Q1_9PEZI|nr:hypothetical protein QBC35DRAFT_223516 [Podospora australis]
MSDEQHAYIFRDTLPYRPRRDWTQSSLFSTNDCIGTSTTTSALTRLATSTAPTSQPEDPVYVSETLFSIEPEYILATSPEPLSDRVFRHDGYMVTAPQGYRVTPDVEMTDVDWIGAIGLTGSMEALPGSTPSSRQSTAYDVAYASREAGQAVADESMARQEKRKTKKERSDRRKPQTLQQFGFEDGNTSLPGRISHVDQTSHDIHRQNASAAAPPDNLVSAQFQGYFYHYPQTIADDDIQDEEAQEELDWIVVDSNVPHY